MTSSETDVVTYSETLDIYRIRTHSLTLDPGFSSWIHVNPAENHSGLFTSEKYESAANSGNISASLSLQIEDLDLNDSVYVWIKDRWDTWQGLG